MNPHRVQQYYYNQPVIPQMGPGFPLQDDPARAFGPHSQIGLFQEPNNFNLGMNPLPHPPAQNPGPLPPVQDELLHRWANFPELDPRALQAELAFVPINKPSPQSAVDPTVINQDNGFWDKAEAQDFFPDLGY